MSTTQARMCKGTTKDGKPCGGWAVAGSDYCYNHAPELAAARAESRKRGGRARHGRKLTIEDTPPAALATTGDMLDALEYALKVALSLEASHNQVRSIVSVVTAALKVSEVGELEARIAALEQLQQQHAIAQGNGNGAY